MSGDTAALRERRTLVAAGLANGPYELVDFILPLFWTAWKLGRSRR